MKKLCIICFLGLLFVAPLYAAKEEVLYTTRSLSVEMASKAVWGAVNECRKRGYSVAVAIVDRGGNLQAYLRDQFAGPHTMETAYRKAWTANSFRQNTSDLAEIGRASCRERVLRLV